MNPKCPYCNSKSNKKQKINDKQQYKCTVCKKHFIITDKKTAPNILLFDIETIYSVAAVFQAKTSFISIDQILKDECMLSWSAKWLNDNEMMSDILTPQEARKRNDKRIVKKLWQLLDVADVVIAHYGDGFDIPKCNSYFAVNGLTPPSPYQTVDTKKVSSKNFAFFSNKLDFLAKRFKKDRKIETNFQLWKDCDNGNIEALNKMIKYNEMDVFVLEEIYRELVPWVKSHPNYNLYTDGEVCSNCGADSLKLKGNYNTTVNQYNSYRCKSCGAYNVRMGKKLKSVAR